MTDTTVRPAPDAARRTFDLRRIGREVLLMATLFMIYNLGRVVGAQDVTGAFANARDVLRVEQWLHLPNEKAVQALILPIPLLVQAANRYYAYVHFPLTFGVLFYLFLRRPVQYGWARRALVIATAVALVVYMTVPVAPPRLLSGFVDTGVLYGLSVYDRPGTASLSNQFAAMPSLHVGWAVLVAVVLIASARTRWRWLWVLHPVITLAVVVATANHYWLDGLLGASLVGITLWLTRPRASRSSDPAPSPRRPLLPAGAARPAGS